MENTGSVPGKEVVQLYFQSPYTDYDRQNGIEKSSVELCGFAKTGVLAPGQSEELSYLTTINHREKEEKG